MCIVRDKGEIRDWPRVFKKRQQEMFIFFSLGMNPMFLRTKIYLYNFYLSSLDWLED